MMVEHFTFIFNKFAMEGATFSILSLKDQEYKNTNWSGRIGNETLILNGSIFVYIYIKLFLYITYFYFIICIYNHFIIDIIISTCIYIFLINFFFIYILYILPTKIYFKKKKKKDANLDTCKLVSLLFLLFLNMFLNVACFTACKLQGSHRREKARFLQLHFEGRLSTLKGNSRGTNVKLALKPASWSSPLSFLPPPPAAALRYARLQKHRGTADSRLRSILITR